MSLKTPSKVLEDLFSGKLDGAKGHEKIAEYGAEYIRERLREGLPHVLPPEKFKMPEPVQLPIVPEVDEEPRTARIEMIYNQFKAPRHLIKGEDDATENK